MKNIALAILAVGMMFCSILVHMEHAVSSGLFGFCLGIISLAATIATLIV